MSSEEYNEELGIYDDEGNRMVKNTQANGRFHSDWCSMIYSRLMLAGNLLTDDGVIFISIDYNENFNLRNILNEVFGMSSFIGEIYWESKTKSQNTIESYNKLQPKAEMILVYSRQEKRRFNLVKEGDKEYIFTDHKGVYREHILEVMDSTGVRGRNTMVFDISDGVSTVSLLEGKQWKIGQEQVDFYKKQGDLFIRSDKVIIKMRPDYERTEKTKPFWGFFSKKIGTAESAKQELKSIVGENDFETVKPRRLIEMLAFHASTKDCIILDFFSGSSTTAHAVMQLNAEDGGNRKFIMVQLPEDTDKEKASFKAGYKNICEIGKERIRRAGDKILEELNKNATNEQLNLEDEDIQDRKPLDIGFRVLKLDDTNMLDVYYSPEEYDQNILEKLVSNIKTDRTDLDLLFGCLLEWGLPLSMPYTSEKIDGSTVHTYNDGDLIVCFDENIKDSTIKEIAKRKPLRVVFRDSSFEDSPAKINVKEIFKLFAPDTMLKVL